MEQPKTYEQVLEMMQGRSEEEMQVRLAEASKMCMCAACPSYVDTGETELLFCGLGRSKVIVEEKGCTCPGCPVQQNMALRWTYYCTKGSGREILAQEA